ncbi:MAG: hypothetical protein MUC87_11085 [Bacteroidia bacterium]|jgi:hypothetical protein|nr:hypothetical protein [Bacteroidia bacterium]
MKISSLFLLPLILISVEKPPSSFNPSQPFQLINIYTSHNFESSGDTVDCKHKQLTPARLQTVISGCKPISGEQFHSDFLVFPCGYHCQIVQKQDTFNCRFNIGGWMYLENSDTTIIYGNYYPAHQKYFIGGPLER